MASTTVIDVAALRALLAKATPGEWEATGRAIDRADAPFTEIAVDRCDADWCGNSSGIERSDDAALIAAAVNALPALLDLAEGAGGLVTGRTFDPETLVLALDAATTRAEAAEREAQRLRALAQKHVERDARSPDIAKARTPDWACAECRPDSDMLKPDFRCAFHELTAAIARKEA